MALVQCDRALGEPGQGEARRDRGARCEGTSCRITYRYPSWFFPGHALDIGAKVGDSGVTLGQRQETETRFDRGVTEADTASHRDVAGLHGLVFLVES